MANTQSPTLSIRLKPETKKRLAIRIVAVVEAVKTHPRLGRVGVEPGTRELLVRNADYIFTHRMREHRIVINGIRNEK